MLARTLRVEGTESSDCPKIKRRRKKDEKTEKVTESLRSRRFTLKKGIQDGVVREGVFRVSKDVLVHTENPFIDSGRVRVAGYM